MRLGRRFMGTAEIAVSKLLPGGFGWQAASLVAPFEADTLGFALSTGVGDAIGVAIGHFSWFAAKKAVTGNSSINLAAERDTALWLGSACVFSGGAWQPLVNFLHDTAGCSFNQTVAGVTVGCGAMFFLGLRLGRMLYSGWTTVAPDEYGNLKADAYLSLAIGGATGAFVGTDVSFMTAAGTEQNWLRPLLGVEDSTADLVGCLTAGSSTALGYSTLQSVQNVVLPAGKNYLD